MRVLCVIPPYIPSYFNAGHHLPVFQVAQYLRKSLGLNVKAMDCAALNTNWREVCKLLVEQFDLILMLNDYDAVDNFERFIQYAREIAPGSKIATFGRASRDVPEFFDRFALDAIGSAGDYEVSMRSYVRYLIDGSEPQGLRLRQPDGRYKVYSRLEWLPAENWEFPDIREIPYRAYENLYKDDLNKFCGIAHRAELILPVARGCPVGCGFCDVPRQQGLRERRVTVDKVVKYITESFAAYPFEYVSFYAPTFTLKRNWVKELCEELRVRGVSISWKCVTTVAHLDHELIGLMQDAGCVRISVGVESFATEAAEYLPKVKRESRDAFLKIAKSCEEFNIELNCFIMLGLPGEPVSQSIQTMKALVEDGHRVRPTVYTPYENMTSDMTIAQFSAFNRQLFLHHDIPCADKDLLYQALYANDFDVASAVHLKVPEVKHDTEMAAE